MRSPFKVPFVIRYEDDSGARKIYIRRTRMDADYTFNMLREPDSSGRRAVVTMYENCGFWFTMKQIFLWQRGVDRRTVKRGRTN